MAKLNVKAFGLASGVLWGTSMIVMGIVAMTVPGYGGGFVRAIGSMYIGYKATALGCIIGGLWGFIDAGIGGLVLAWLYNKLAK